MTRYDYILFSSRTDEETAAGLESAFRAFLPNRIILFHLGEPVDIPPKEVKKVVNEFQGELVARPVLSPLGGVQSKLELEALPFTIIEEMQDGVIEHLPEYFQNGYSGERPVIILGGTKFHCQLLMTLGISMDAILMNRKKRGGESTAICQDWINGGNDYSDISKGGRELLTLFISKLVSNDDNKTKLSGEEIIGGTETKYLKAANGISNAAGPLLKRKFLSKIDGSDPVQYELTGRGWFAAIQLVGNQMDDSKAMDSVKGRISPVNAVLRDDTLAATSVYDRLSPVNHVITLFSRIHDEMEYGMDCDPDRELNDEKLGSYIEARGKWEEYLEMKNINHLGWALFNAEEDKLEESFKSFCEWLYPRLMSSKLQDDGDSGQDIHWVIDTTQLNIHQLICATLLTSSLPIQSTYLMKSQNIKGVTDRKITMPNDPADCELIMPNRTIANLLSSLKNDLTKESLILASLLMRERKQEEIDKVYRTNLLEIDNPFADLTNVQPPPDFSPFSYIEELHDMIEKMIQRGEIDSRFRLDKGGKESKDINRRAKMWGRAKQDLVTDGLCIEKLTDKKVKLCLTYLGRIISQRIIGGNHLG